MIEIVQTGCTGLLVYSPYCNRSDSSIEVFRTYFIPTHAADRFQFMLVPNFAEVTKIADFLTLGRRQCSIILHIGFHLNKPFIHRLGDAVLNVSESADMDHHRSMFCVVSSQITNRIEQQKIRHSFIQTGRKCINYEILFVGKREEQIHLITPQRDKCIRKAGLITKNLVCTNVVSRRSQRIDEISREQIIAYHLIFRFRINENISEGGCSNAKVRRLIELMKQLSDTGIDSSRAVVLAAGIYRRIISLIVNQQHRKHNLASGVISAFRQPFD